MVRKNKAIRPLITIERTKRSLKMERRNHRIVQLAKKGKIIQGDNHINTIMSLKPKDVLSIAAKINFYRWIIIKNFINIKTELEYPSKLRRLLVFLFIFEE